MNKSMKLKVVGVIFLALGIVGLQLNPNRQEENLKIARTATNAYEAAKAISENNQKEIFYSSVAYGLLGFGISLTVGGFVLNQNYLIILPYKRGVGEIRRVKKMKISLPRIQIL